MHKKHFEAIAAAVAKHSNDTSVINFDRLCRDIASELQKLSPEFHEKKFLRACGVGEPCPLPDLRHVKTWKYYQDRK